jgi:hypothetical protein
LTIFVIADAGKKSSRKKPQRKKSSLTAAKTPLFPQTFDNVVGKRPSTMQFRFENDVDADKEPVSLIMLFVRLLRSITNISCYRNEKLLHHLRFPRRRLLPISSSRLNT